MNHQEQINACRRRNFPLLTLSWLLAVASLMSLMLVFNGQGYRRIYARFVEISKAPRAKRLPGEPVDVLRYPGMAAFLKRYVGRSCAAFFLTMASIALAAVQVEYAYFAEHPASMKSVVIVL